MTRRPDDVPKDGQPRDDHWHGRTKHEHAWIVGDDHSHGSELYEPARDAFEVFEAGVPATYGPVVHEHDKTFRPYRPPR